MSDAPDEAAIEKVWSHYWKSVAKLDDWDSLSELIYLTLYRELQQQLDQEVLEAGCGTGRISYRLALAGGRVTCLDITEEALALARLTFGETPGRFIRGSILNLPKDHSYDMVWNAGVLEHFSPEDQGRALAEFIRVLSPRGVVVLLTPYSRSPLYRLGKFVLEKLGRWPYGVEIPEASLADRVPPNAILEREYTVALLPLLFDSYKFLSPLRTPLRWSWQRLLGLLGPAQISHLDKVLSRLLGGYLLVSILRQRPEEGSASTRPGPAQKEEASG